MAIAEILDVTHKDDGSNTFKYTVEVKLLDDWKFNRWIEMMNEYDNMRKGSHNYHKLLREISDDYDKDFKEE